MNDNHQQVVNIIEPTLASEAGHCFSFINSLCQVKGSASFVLWISKENSIIFDCKNTTINNFFSRRFRKLQSIFLYRKLVRSDEKIFISTAGFIDLFFLNIASSGMLPVGKVFLYFHWMNNAEKKLSKLKEFAKRQPNLTIICPTHTIANFFKSSGFLNINVIPYPVGLKKLNSVAPLVSAFSSVLFAGAAREDKGFSKFVDLVNYAHIKKLTLPFSIQISSDHKGEYDVETEKNIDFLKSIPYPYLKIYEKTLSVDDYANLFAGVICIQLYRAADFADRVSGVTLDALVAGCPILTTEGTWIANQVTRFNAGIVVSSTSPECVYDALMKVVENFGFYNKNAVNAGFILQDEHSASHLVNVLLVN